MNDNLKKLLKNIREKRDFQPEVYLREKSKMINKFFQKENLDSVVLGLSGGVDSAVVLKLLIHAQKQENSPLKKIMAIMAPIYGDGVTGQEEATDKAQRLCSTLSGDGFIWATVDLTDAYESIVRESAWKDDAWSRGRMAPILRTPVFYYHAALLQATGNKSVVCGTTNRDEYFLGFFGKCSDNANDIQVLTDIHKSEVYQLAKLLNIPKEILEGVPKGDVWDDKNDEEMIGCSYDFVELYQNLKCNSIKNTMSVEEEKFFDFSSIKIEECRNKNKHKFKGSASHHIVIDYDR